MGLDGPPCVVAATGRCNYSDAGGGFLRRIGRIFCADTKGGDNARYRYARHYPPAYTRPFNTLAVALFAVLAFDPLAVMSVGFWLSFLAVGLIVYVIAGRLGKSGYFSEVIKINWATSVGLSPLLLFFFQQVSLISPLANFIAVPVISLVAVPLSLLGVLLMFGSPLIASKLFIIVDTALQGLW